MIKLKKFNKKGYAGALVDFFSWIAYFIILIIFIALFSSAAKTAAKEEALSGIGISSESLLLSSYLRTPISFEGKEINIAEAIALYYMEENKDKKKEYRNKILSDTQKILNQAEFCHRKINKQIRGYALYIFDKDYSEVGISQKYSGMLLNQDKKFKSDHFEDNLAKTISLPNQALPLPDGNIMYVNIMVSDEATDLYNVGIRGC